MDNIQGSVNDITSLNHLQGMILGVADKLVNDDNETREDLASELIYVAHRMHEQATVMFREFEKTKSPSHSDQG